MVETVQANRRDPEGICTVARRRRRRTFRRECRRVTPPRSFGQRIASASCWCSRRWRKDPAPRRVMGCAWPSKIERGTIRGTKWRPTGGRDEHGERLDVQECAVW